MVGCTTCATVCTRDIGTDPVMAELKSILWQQFSVEHITIQFERRDADDCPTEHEAGSR